MTDYDRPANLAQAFDDALTADEWWAEWQANACCPSASHAARTLCGCGGSAASPTGISRLLDHDDEGEY